MKADSLQMAKVFSSGGDIHYVLPHFQREYAWGQQEWDTLLADIFGVYEIYKDEDPPEHFMGSLVVINDGTRAGTVPVFRLVDGQQRLTTISLLLCALHRLLDSSEAHESLRRKLRRMLLNPDESGDLHFKLLPTLKYGDRASYCATVTNRELPAGVDSRVPAAFAYLRDQLGLRLKSGEIDPDRFFNVLMNSLQVVFINLSQTERPYEIFESLNYKGKSLTQADLVRNYIAMKLPPERQEPVFRELWSPVEDLLLEKRTVGRSRLGELTGFLRHYFAYLSGVLINEEHVYSRFRDRGQRMSAADFEQELRQIKRFAFYYDLLLRPQKEADEDVRQQMKRLEVLESSTAYPFLLYMYDEWKQNRISRQDFLEGLRIIETYMVRRFLNRESTNYLNKMFPALIKDINTADFTASLRQVLGVRNEPSDVRLRQVAETLSLYRGDLGSRQKLALIFDTINRELSAGTGAYTVLNDDPTIEHIMPQTLSNAWKEHLGENWQQDHVFLHTLGNPTVVTQEWNSQLSNNHYVVKRERLAAHGLRLNSIYFSKHAPAIWNRQAIRQRAEWLMSKIVMLWPQLGESTDGGEQTPKAVVILGQTYLVDSWRDVVRCTADAAAILCGDDFEQQVVVKWPNYFRYDPPSNFDWYKLANGWGVYVNNNISIHKKLYATIVDAVGILAGEYKIIYW